MGYQIHDSSSRDNSEQKSNNLCFTQDILLRFIAQTWIKFSELWPCSSNVINSSWTAPYYIQIIHRLTWVIVFKYVLVQSECFVWSKRCQICGLSLGETTYLTCGRITRNQYSPFPTWTCWLTKDNWSEKCWDKRKVEVKQTANFVL